MPRSRGATIPELQERERNRALERKRTLCIYAEKSENERWIEESHRCGSFDRATYQAHLLLLSVGERKKEKKILHVCMCTPTRIARPGAALSSAATRNFVRASVPRTDSF